MGNVRIPLPWWLAIRVISTIMLLPQVGHAETVRVSVASIHQPVMAQIATGFSKATGNMVMLVEKPNCEDVPAGHLPCAADATVRDNPSGTTPPFQSTPQADIVIEAQDWRAEAVKPGRSVTFAIAQIALWSPDPALIDPKGDVLASQRYRSISLPEPQEGPFGRATYAVLYKAGVLESIRPRLLTGSTTRESLRAIESGQAQLGFVALPQVWQEGRLESGSLWIPPLAWYPVIAMTATLVDQTRPSGSKASTQFLRYLLEPSVQQILLRHGYLAPAGLVSS